VNPKAEARRRNKHAEVLAYRNLDPDARAALEGDDVAALRLLALDLLAEQRAVSGGRCVGCDDRIYAGERYDDGWYMDLCMACTDACDATGEKASVRAGPESAWYRVRYRTDEHGRAV